MSTKLNLNKKPEYFLLVASFVFFLSSAFWPTDQIVFQDIKMFSVPIKTIFWIIPLFPVFLFALYLLTKKLLYSITLAWIHAVITVLVTILVLIVVFVSIDPSQEIIENQETIGSLIQFLFLIFIFTQLVYVTNLLLGILTKRKINQTNGVDF
jgi:cytochrome b561